MYNKILGCLVGAAAGDAMGAATEARSSNQIIDTLQMILVLRILLQKKLLIMQE